MAKKFFYNKVYNTRRTIVNFIIIGVCIIGIILCFIITSNFEAVNLNPPERSLNIKSETTIEVNEIYSKDIFFSKIENVDLDEVEITYPDDFDASKPGKYTVTITINDKNYNSNILVIDTIKPTLVLKNIIKEENNSYNPNDFVESCNDNSGKECVVSFYKDGIDQDGNLINYSAYNEVGVYSVKIEASDESGNKSIEEATLTINPKSGKSPEIQQVCKYGTNEYDKTRFLIAVDITSNGCAISLDLYKDTSMTKEINSIMNTETTRLQKDFNKLNLPGTYALNRKVSAITNATNNGIIGYELKMTASLSNNGNSQIVAEYKIDKDGKRIFTSNPYNLPQ